MGVADLLVDLPELRAEAESLMTDTCSVMAPGTSGTLDQSTGLPTVSVGSVVYAGPVRLRTPGAVSGQNSRDVSGDRVALSQPTASFPFAWNGQPVVIPVGAIIRITAVPPDDPSGPSRLNMRLRVTGRVIGSQMTAQRVTVEVVTG